MIAQAERATTAAEGPGVIDAEKPGMIAQAERATTGADEPGVIGAAERGTIRAGEASTTLRNPCRPTGV